MSKPHLAPDPLPYWPHPFVKRLDAIAVCPGKYQFFCQNKMHMLLIRGRIHGAARRAGTVIGTSYDPDTQILTVWS